MEQRHTRYQVPSLRARAHGLIGTAVQAAVNSARNETQDGKLIVCYGQTYREWLTHGA